MKIKNLMTDGFEAAFRGMRNPLDSWDKSDSQFGFRDARGMDYILSNVAMRWLIANGQEDYEDVLLERYENWLQDNGVYDYDCGDYERFAYIGPNDMKLAQKLIAAGPEHCKFLRQINISFDVVAPFYW